MKTLEQAYCQESNTYIHRKYYDAPSGDANLDGHMNFNKTGNTQGFKNELSVIIPAYNSELYIQSTIKSVQQQNYPDKEIIVINDGSTDRTLEKLAFFGDSISIINQNNSGPATARNAGLQKARGKYIAFLDSDDLWLQDKLRKQVDFLEVNPDIHLVYSTWGILQQTENGKFHEIPDPKNNDSTDRLSIARWLYNELLFESILLTSTVMLRKTLIDQVGLFDTNLLRGQDYDYWLRVSRVTPIKKLRDKLVLYRKHSNSIVKLYPNVDYETIVIEKTVRQWGLVGPDGKRTPRFSIWRHLGELAFGFGYHHFWKGNFRISSGSFLKSVKYNPLRLKSWIYLVLSWWQVFYKSHVKS